MLARLQQEYEKGVHFVSLTIEESDDQATVEDWLKRAGAPGLNIGRASMPVTEELHKVAGQRFRSIPSTVFITTGGTVARVVGGASHDQLDQAVRAIAPK